MRTLRVLVAALLATGLSVANAAAQGVGRRSIGVVATHSMTSGSSAHGPLCPCPGSSDVLASVSVSSLELDVAWAVGRGSGWGLEYPLRIVPLALVRNNPTDFARPNTAGPGWTISSSPPRASTYGFGVKPIGMRGWVGSGHVGMQAEVSGGLMRFGSPLFAANGAQFNFVAELGVGVRIDVPGRGRTVLGYRWHHLSNGGLGEVNPGLNSDVLSLGFWLD
jgi:hypothetical protein